MERLEGAERQQFERAVEWAQWARMGTNGDSAVVSEGIEAAREEENSPVSSEFS
jgi:hypothetical protein